MNQQDLQPKHVYESKTEQVQILMSGHINGYNRLFGGQLMMWIDIVAAVVARRHCNKSVTTASVDNLHFKEAAHVDSTIVVAGQMTHVGRTSMEVRVDTFVEALNGEKKMINRAYLVLVALDENEIPTVVPALIADTEEERAEMAAGERRRALRVQRRTENF